MMVDDGQSWSLRLRRSSTVARTAVRHRLWIQVAGGLRGNRNTTLQNPLQCHLTLIEAWQLGSLGHGSMGLDLPFAGKHNGVPDVCLGGV